ncbi:putative tetrahydrofolylpolyglutamate synthase protein [Botrytis fragariae]|uniref:tetrahydrofolate synthase n=1 Tax=Botrytis fragariae TaxID=1964551 RepID=A0A8H6B3R7_9HELO|nr:putative tetrahydrofolylpolyglutamate synthase protein [Botrytis fragariae]KAF5878608.1 putative tetrahydrofolylpolyglutamate synthase protein [Botrytis fragariae]
MGERTYDDAINALNTLQTPYEVLKKRWEAGIKLDEGANREMKQHLTRIGYTQDDLERLNIVHVAGTKGKGSTCAYVDSILNRYRKSHDLPQKVGLFTSPHLIAVRERIRINSAPISAPMFAKYFFEVWDRLEAAAASPSEPFEKPVYFRYLNLMSYHVFLQEGVDAAIYEVGVGGEYDSTNIVDRPAVTGISSLGIDHVFTLGDTIDKIAWHKAGIQKAGVPSFTVNQKPEAMKVVEKRARGNASLAICLAETVLNKLNPKFSTSSNSLPQEFVDALEQVVWRGRCETKVDGNVTWYLDGAHTADSIIVAAKWFGDEVAKEHGPRVLIFNQQGHREAIGLLEGLHSAIQGSVKFDHVIFCTTSIQKENASKKDFVNLSYDPKSISELTMQKAFAEKWRSLDFNLETDVQVLPSVEDAFEYVRGLATDEVHAQALITGSVHLVGRALGSLESVDAL